MQQSRLMRSIVATVLVATMVAPVAAQNSLHTQSTDGFLNRLADLINDYRARNGLAPLALADDLAALADEHSANMSSRRQLSHEGFRERFRNARSRLCVENVGWNYATAEGLLEGWRGSPAHHRNLLDPGVSRMGLANSARYVTYFACR